MIYIYIYIHMYRKKDGNDKRNKETNNEHTLIDM